MKLAFHYIPGSIALALCCLFLPAHAAAGEASVESPSDLEDRPGKTSLRIESKVDDGRWQKPRGLDIRQDQSLRLRLDPELNLEDAEVRWYLVFADITREYQNANKPWEDDPGDWTGFDELQYYRVELTQLRNHSEGSPFADLDSALTTIRAHLSEEGASKRALSRYDSELGTFFFQVEVERDGSIQRSPGLQDIGKKGISKKVLRVSVRPDDSYLGHLMSFYNVPSVFGSTTWQSQNHVAVDCADVLMAAYFDWLGKRMKKNVNVAMVARKFDVKAETRVEDGVPIESLAWGEDIAPGDLIAVQYDAAWSTRYNHIGALAGDTDGDGVLSEDDLVLHAGPDPLHADPLSGGAFDGTVSIVRPE